MPLPPQAERFENSSEIERTTRTQEIAVLINEALVDGALLAEQDAKLGTELPPANVMFRDPELCAFCHKRTPEARSSCGCEIFCASCAAQIAGIKDPARSNKIQRGLCPLHTQGVKILPIVRPKAPRAPLILAE